jgi:Protein of unknown function (DUF2845)
MLRPVGDEAALPRRAVTGCAATALVGLALLAAAPAQAMHCGSAVISSGDDVDKLLQFCGDPESVKTYPIVRTPIDGNGRVYHGFREELRVEEWTYNFGPSQLMTKVRIENGFVTDVRYLGYGH